MISVDEALSRAFALAPAMPTEMVPLRQAFGRVLTGSVSARRDQPPFPSSAMDGYAVMGEGFGPGTTYDVIGTSAAGRGFDGAVETGQAVRIFTGAPVPPGADRVVIQEDVLREGDRITIGPKADPDTNIRAAGCDFRVGDGITGPRRLSASECALLAAMNVAEVPVARRPVVALIATGDELVLPGENPGPDQIIASNNYALAPIAEMEGAEVRILPIARDNAASIKLAFGLAEGADLIVTSGGASVGDHDLIGPVAAELGMEQSFYKVAMRPGKPLMAGRLGDAMMLGLPGNPVSATVCGNVFLRPVLRAMQGLPATALPRQKAPLAAPVAANGPREHYMRASLAEDGTIVAADRQDSSLLSVLTGSNALLVRPPNAPAAVDGESVEFILI